MPLSVEVGSFVFPASGADVGVSTSFEPKALILWWVSSLTNYALDTHIAGPPTDPYPSFGMGFTDGTRHYCQSFAGYIWESATRPGSGAWNNKSIAHTAGLSGSPNSQLWASGVITFRDLLDSGYPGFDVATTWDRGDVTHDWRVGYMALGGDIEAYVKNDYSLPATTGSSSVTGVPFPPDVGFSMISRGDGFSLNTPGSGTNTGHGSFGWAFRLDPFLDETTVQGTLVAAYGITPQGEESNTAFIVGLSSGGVRRSRAAVTSWNSDGITLNVDDAPASSNPVGFLFLKNVRCVATQFNRSSTSETGETMTTFAEQPIGLIGICHHQQIANNNTISGGFAFGGYDGSIQRTSYGQYGGNIGTFGDTYETDSLLYRSGAFYVDGASLDSDGYTLSYTDGDNGTATGTATDYMIIAFGFLRVVTNHLLPLTGAGRA